MVDPKPIAQSVIRDLTRYGTVKKFNEGEIILDEQSYIRNIPIVLKGSVKVFQNDSDEKEMLLYYLRPLDACIMSFFGALYNETSRIKAVANEESELLLIPVEKIGEITRRFPEWNSYIFQIYHQRFIELLDVVNAIAFKKMDERLLHFLKKRSEVLSTRNLEITHDELAGELGTARVVISRLLKQMERQGLVALARNRITLL